MSKLPVLATPQDKEKHLAALGSAISNWQTVETFAGMLFANVLQPPDHQAGLVAFDAIANFRDKMRALNSIILWRFKNGEMVEKWEKIYRDADKLSLKRNAIAHSMLVEFSQNDGSKSDYYRIPSLVRYRDLHFQPDKLRKHLKSTTELQEIDAAFVQLYQAVMEFAWEVEELNVKSKSEATK